MIALFLLLTSEVHVDASSSCVGNADINDALEAVGGIDVAESVSLVVGAVPDPNGLYGVAIDIALARVEPLHRELAIKPVECADLPDLVALLVKEQRALAASTPQRPKPRPPPPERPHRNNDDRVYLAPNSCDGSPMPCGADPAHAGCCGGPATRAGLCSAPDDRSGLALQLGYGALLAFPLSSAADLQYVRAKADFDFQVEPNTSVVVDAAVGHSTSAGFGAVVGGGMMWTNVVGDGLRISLLTTVDAGYTSGHELYVDGVVKPSSTLDHIVVTPTVAARLRTSYVFGEVGAFGWIVDRLPAAGAYLAVGVYF